MKPQLCMKGWDKYSDQRLPNNINSSKHYRNEQSQEFFHMVQQKERWKESKIDRVLLIRSGWKHGQLWNDYSIMEDQVITLDY